MASIAKSPRREIKGTLLKPGGNGCEQGPKQVLCKGGGKRMRLSISPETGIQSDQRKGPMYRKIIKAPERVELANSEPAWETRIYSYRARDATSAIGGQEGSTVTKRKDGGGMRRSSSKATLVRELHAAPGQEVSSGGGVIELGVERSKEVRILK